jgi:hypothetical protein
MMPLLRERGGLASHVMRVERENKRFVVDA